MFPFISHSDIVSINLVILILENIGQCDVITFNTNKNKNISLESIDMHYHSLIQVIMTVSTLIIAVILHIIRLSPDRYRHNKNDQ